MGFQVYFFLRGLSNLVVDKWFICLCSKPRLIIYSIPPILCILTLEPQALLDRKLQIPVIVFITLLFRVHDVFTLSFLALETHAVLNRMLKLVVLITWVFKMAWDAKPGSAEGRAHVARDGNPRINLWGGS
jgi:hypothetical protein